MQKQKAIVAGGGDQDVIVTQRQQEDALVQMLLVRGGKMIGSELHVIERAGDEPEDEILVSFMLQYYGEDHMPAREILIGQPVAEVETLAPLLSEKCGRKVVITQPQRGEKRQLVDMAMKNLRDAALKRERRLANAYSRTLGALRELQEALGIDNLPLRIEGYDISNTQGAQSVGSMVVMKGGLSSNKDYRIFRIRTVEGPNDFASMREVITRRLTHGLKEREERLSQGLDPAGGRFSELPDLILIDGGRGQLNAALEAMRECGLSIPMFGLAKRVEEIVLPDEETSIFLDRHSEALHLIQRLRDEAHRFAITHHRSLRSSAALSSRLDAIPGIGPARKRALLTHFTTIQELLAADEKALCQVDGVSEKTAALIWRALHGEG